MLTLLETCSARRLLDLILRYAPNKVKKGVVPPARAAGAPDLRTAPHSPRGKGASPLHPQNRPFSSSVFRHTILWS